MQRGTSSSVVNEEDVRPAGEFLLQRRGRSTSSSVVNNCAEEDERPAGREARGVGREINVRRRWEKRYADGKIDRAGRTTGQTGCAVVPGPTNRKKRLD